MPFGVVLDDLLTELGTGATNFEATRVAVPIFLERRAMFGGACNGAAGAGNVENCGRGAVVLRGVARAWFLCLGGLVLLEGTPCALLTGYTTCTMYKLALAAHKTAQLFILIDAGGLLN